MMRLGRYQFVGVSRHSHLSDFKCVWLSLTEATGVDPSRVLLAPLFSEDLCNLSHSSLTDDFSKRHRGWNEFSKLLRLWLRLAISPPCLFGYLWVCCGTAIAHIEID